MRYEDVPYLSLETKGESVLLFYLEAYPNGHFIAINFACFFFLFFGSQ